MNKAEGPIRGLPPCLRGRYWDRTSDLCRVKAAQGSSLTWGSRSATFETWVLASRHISRFRTVSFPHVGLAWGWDGMLWLSDIPTTPAVPLPRWLAGHRVSFWQFLTAAVSRAPNVPTSGTALSTATSATSFRLAVPRFRYSSYGRLPDRRKAEAPPPRVVQLRPRVDRRRRDLIPVEQSCQVDLDDGMPRVPKGLCVRHLLTQGPDSQRNTFRFNTDDHSDNVETCGNLSDDTLWPPNPAPPSWGLGETQRQIATGAAIKTGAPT